MRTRSNRTFGIVRKCFAVFIMTAFVFNTVFPSYAQTAMVLPVPGTVVGSSAAFTPVILKAVKVHPENPFQFEFIVDVGSAKLSEAEIKTESQKLIRYFLASLTIPENDLWVNLSPFEKDRIVPQSFGVTEMGRDLLGEDYILKQLSASLTKPDTESGKRYWEEVGTVPALKGTVPTSSLSKVWIVPQKAVVYENGPTAYVSETKLKVMMEEDYKDLSSPRKRGSILNDGEKMDSRLRGNDISDVFRNVILPKIEQDVNEGKNFAAVRQIYNSLILANWYKKRLKDSILAQIYVDKKKVAGVDIDDKAEAQKIYDRYLEAFKKGVYNYIKEDYDPATDETIPRKYFSGGLGLTAASSATVIIPGIAPEARDSASSSLRRIDADFAFSNQGRLFQPQIASAHEGILSKHLASSSLKVDRHKFEVRDRQLREILQSLDGRLPEETESALELYLHARSIANRIEHLGYDIPKNIYLPYFINDVFTWAGQDARVVFLEAGAKPLYDAALLMAKVNGGFPTQNLYSAWGATMRNYNEMQQDEEQAELFVKFWFDQGVLKPGRNKLRIVDTDIGIGSLGTALIFAKTLLDNSFIDRVNKRFPKMQLQYFNEGDPQNSLEFLYMYSGYDKYKKSWDFHIREEGIPEEIAKKLIVRGYISVGGTAYRQILERESPDEDINTDARIRSNVDSIASIHSQIDGFVKDTNMSDRYSWDTQTGHVSLHEVDPREQISSDKGILFVLRTIQNTGLLIGVLEAMEVMGYDVTARAQALIDHLRETINKSGLAAASPAKAPGFNSPGVSTQKPISSSALTPGGIDLTRGKMPLEIRGPKGQIAVPFQFDPAQIKNFKFDGLVPVIINITPEVNLPMFLSENSSPSPGPMASKIN